MGREQLRRAQLDLGFDSRLQLLPRAQHLPIDDAVAFVKGSQQLCGVSRLESDEYERGLTLAASVVKATVSCPIIDSQKQS